MSKTWFARIGYCKHCGRRSKTVLCATCFDKTTEKNIKENEQVMNMEGTETPVVPVTKSDKLAKRIGIWKKRLANRQNTLAKLKAKTDRFEMFSAKIVEKIESGEARLAKLQSGNTTLSGAVAPATPEAPKTTE